MKVKSIIGKLEASIDTFLEQKKHLSEYSIRNHKLDISKLIFFLNENLDQEFNLDLVRKFISELRNQAAIKRVIIRDQKLLSRSNLIFTIDLKS